MRLTCKASEAGWLRSQQHPGIDRDRYLVLIMVPSDLVVVILAGWRQRNQTRSRYAPYGVISLQIMNNRLFRRTLIAAQMDVPCEYSTAFYGDAAADAD